MTTLVSRLRRGGARGIIGGISLLGVGASVLHDSTGPPPRTQETGARASSWATSGLIDTDPRRRAAAISRDADRSTEVGPAPAGSTPPAAAVAARTEAQERVARRADARASELAAAKWVAPLAAYRVTAQFGASGSAWSADHTGLDLAASTGTPIRSISPGVVVSSGWSGAYGLRTVVRLADGTEVWYAHQSATRVVAEQAVRSGQMIGSVGATGNVTGSHVHLEVRPPGGAPRDPALLLRRNGVRL